MSENISHDFIKKGSLLLKKFAKYIIDNNFRIICGAVDVGIIGSFLKYFENSKDIIDSAVTNDEIKFQIDGVNSVKKFEDYKIRQNYMFDLVNNIIFLPGGLGTLHEICSILIERKVVKNSKNIFLVNIDGFWNPFYELLEKMKNNKFVLGSDIKIFTISSENDFNIVSRVS